MIYSKCTTRKRQKRPKIEFSQTVFLVTTFTVLLCVLYMMSVTCVRSYSLSISVKGQALESENIALQSKITELQQEIDDIKKEKSSEASQHSSFKKNDQNITIFANASD